MVEVGGILGNVPEIIYYNIKTLSQIVLRKVILKDGSAVMIENKLEDTKLYREFFIEVKDRIRSAQLKALRAVNKSILGDRRINRYKAAGARLGERQ
jgi:hypothetical protein